MVYSKTALNLAGQKFGELTAVRRAGTRKRSASDVVALWVCRCSCGQEIVAQTRLLRRGKKKACGIDGHHYRPTKGKGLAQLHSAEYRTFRSMWKRCTGRDLKNARNYKLRGIRICDRWKSFKAFFEDMGPKPTPKHTLDRYPNNDGNYEPGNCRWATTKEQNRNMRRNTVVEYQGERMLLLDVVERLGLNRAAVYGRIKMGWTLADALSIPIRARKKNRKPIPSLSKGQHSCLNSTTQLPL